MVLSWARTSAYGARRDAAAPLYFSSFFFLSFFGAGLCGGAPAPAPPGSRFFAMAPKPRA